jgi:2-oxo-4-hydroxy-4-carboxy--5-ureidoimidazoline (OHCU) decarboxylase
MKKLGSVAIAQANSTSVSHLFGRRIKKNEEPDLRSLTAEMWRASKLKLNDMVT